MEEERELILKLVAEGKITADEADALLQALEEGDSWQEESEPAGPPRADGVNPELGADTSRNGSEAARWIPGPARRERVRVEGPADFDQLGKMIEGIMNRVGDELKHIPDRLAHLGVSLGGQRVTVERSTAWTGETGVIQVRNPWGDVSVQAWGESRVEAVADFRVPVDPEGGDAERTLQESGLIFEQGAGGLRIEVAQKPSSFGRRLVVGLVINSVDLNLRVPRGARVEAVTASGDISLYGDLGSVSAETASGDLEVVGGAGDLRGISRSGDVSVQGFSGEALNLESQSGDIEAEATASRATLRTVSGDIGARLRGCRECRVETASGDLGIEVEALAGANLEARSASGDIGFSLIGNPGLQVEMTSASGDLGCRRSLNQVQEGRGSIRGTSGDGSVAVRLASASGDITLR